MAHGLCSSCYSEHRRTASGWIRKVPRRTTGNYKVARERADCHPDREHRGLGLCGRCYQAKWTKEHPEKRKKDEVMRRIRLHKRHGVPAGVKMERCAICGDGPDITGRKSLALDHDHGTGKFRGFLCDRCNPGLGYFGDSPILLRAAASYLADFAANFEAV